MALLFWIGVATQAFTFIELLRRKMAWKLCFFMAFVLAMTIRNSVLGLNFTSGYYIEIQAATAPLMAALQIAATLQAAWWLTIAMVDFTRYGVSIFAVVTAGALAWARWNADPQPYAESIIRYLYTIEHAVGFALGISMLVGALAFGLLGAPRSPKWHALSLALMFIGNAVAWQMVSNYMLLGTCIGALSLWCARVHDAPNWTGRKAVEFDDSGMAKDFDDLVKDRRKDIDPLCQS